MFEGASDRRGGAKGELERSDPRSAVADAFASAWYSSVPLSSLNNIHTTSGYTTCSEVDVSHTGQSTSQRRTESEAKGDATPMGRVIVSRIERLRMPLLEVRVWRRSLSLSGQSFASETFHAFTSSDAPLFSQSALPRAPI